jgi:hypothetical protein
MPADGLTCREFVELSTHYLEDALDASLREVVERHLHFCEGCRSYVSQERALSRLLRYHLRGHVAPADRLRALESFRAWKLQRASAGTSG